MQNVVHTYLYYTDLYYCRQQIWKLKKVACLNNYLAPVTGAVVECLCSYDLIWAGMPPNLD